MSWIAVAAVAGATLGPELLGGGGGGGSSGQTATGTQTQVTDLPGWAQPYAQTALERGAALSETPYQAYGGQRIAGFSPMQLAAQQQAANMQTNAATGQGIGLAGQAGQAAMNQNYQAGNFYGGRFGDRQAAQYMSPFIEQSLQPQLREAQRASDIQATQNASRATQQGAFGGSRSAIVEAERQRNLAMQQGDIRARGLQDAYTQAQNQFNADMSRNLQAQQLGEQSRQYGAGLQLQGLQTGLTAANTLGALGGQQFQQGIDINKLQNAYGGQQQALQQQGLDLAYQDFLNQQNYPYKQLGFYSDLIRGLPLGQSSTKTVYEANPSTAQQIGSLGLGAYGLSKFMAEGGMAYADGGSVESPENVQHIVSKLSDQQLQQAARAAQGRGDADQLEAIQSELAMRASERRGLASAVTPQMVQRMAGGGVVAFAKGGINDYMSTLSSLGNQDPSITDEQRMQGIQALLPQVQAMYGPSKTAGFADEIAQERAEAKASGSDKAKGLGALMAAQALVQPGPKARSIGNAFAAFGTEVAKIDKENKEADRQLRQAQITLAAADQARADGQINAASNLFKQGQDDKEKALDRKISVAEKQATIEGGLEQARIHAAATTAAANKPTFDMSMVKAKINEAIKADPTIANDPKRMAALEAKAYSDTAREVKSVYPSAQRADIAADTAREKVRENVLSELMNPKAPDYNTYKALLAQDKQNGTNTAGSFVEGLVNKRTGGGQPQQGGAPQQPTQQPAARVPDLNTWMAAAKKANPGVSDADLTAYYNSKYK